MKLIGLMGAKGAGKDHFYTIAESIYGKERARRFAFADALRDEIESAFLIDREWLTNPSTKETPLEKLALRYCSDPAFVGIMHKLHGELDMAAPRSPRWVMQQWGTEYRQGIDKDYWLRWFGRAYRQALLDGVDLFICTDVRFNQEIRAVEMLGGKLVAIRNRHAEALITPQSHASEQWWMLCTQRTDIFNTYPADDGGMFHDAVRMFLARQVSQAQVQH